MNRHVALLIALLYGAGCCVGQTNYVSLKIAPPPGGGVYLGQHQWRSDDMSSFEAAAGQRAALFGQDDGDAFAVAWDEVTHRIVFKIEEAEAAWQDGRVVWVSAYEATPGTAEEFLPRFTVDRLLNGDYEAHLTNLAAQFRAFGKPMFFQTTREPNGGGVDAGLGGFGPDGDRNWEWAYENGGLADFDPSGFPNAHLYSGLGDPTVSDGVERLVAAQRYYHDFFVRREGLYFLTFDAMGWATLPLSIAADEYGVSPGDPQWRLLETTFSYRYAYPGDGYVDWASITWYLSDWGYTAHDIPWHIDRLRSTMSEIRTIAVGKPVLIIETGFSDGTESDSLASAKVREGVTELLTNHPDIHAFAMWSQSPDLPDFDFLIRPCSPEGLAFRDVVEAHSNRFHSCVYFSDGSRLPTCNTSAPDENIDRDSDGLPDCWEMTYFGNDTNALPQNDDDGDGHDNEREYVAGTDPTNVLSVFRCVDLAHREAPSPATIIRWNSVSNRTYDILRSISPADHEWSFVANDLSSTPPENVYTDSVCDPKQSFYRVLAK